MNFQLKPWTAFLVIEVLSIIFNIRMARQRNRSMLLWSALGYFLPLTSTLVLKFLKPKNRAEELKGNQKSSTIPGERETGGIISRGIAGSEVVDKVLSWVFDEDPPRCPSCRALLATKPKRKTICPFCGKAIYVRTNSSGYTELLNEGRLRFYKR